MTVTRETMRKHWRRLPLCDRFRLRYAFVRMFLEVREWRAAWNAAFGRI